MKRRVISFISLFVVLILILPFVVSCMAIDPLPEDVYTRSSYPGVASTYNVGSAALPYLNGYFDNVFIGGVPVVPGGGGDVSAAANITDDSVVRGDGGAKGVQDSTVGANDVTIDEFGNLTATGNLDGFDINAGNDVNVTNDLDVTDDADIGGILAMGDVIDMNAHQINELADPTLAQDAATKHYVDERTNYAGMYRYESAAVTNIQQINEWHLLQGFTTSAVAGGWAFHDGEQLAITAYANNGDGKTQVTSAGHVLINGDLVSIANTTSYDGVWIVEQVAANTFVIDTVWVADDGASVGEHGSHFQSTEALSAGFYLVTYSLSVQPAIPNTVLECATYYNATLQTESVAQVKLGAITDYQNISGFSFIDLTTLGLVGLAVRNKTNAGDFTIIHGNMTLVKLD